MRHKVERRNWRDREWMNAMELTCTVVVFIMVSETCLGQRRQDDEPFDDTHRAEVGPGLTKYYLVTIWRWYQMMVFVGNIIDINLI